MTPVTHDRMLRIGDASRLLGVSVSTLRRMEETGSLMKFGITVYYTPTRRRRYKENEIIAALEKNAKLAEVPEELVVVGLTV